MTRIVCRWSLGMDSPGNT